MRSHERWLQYTEKAEHLEFVADVLSNYFDTEILTDKDLSAAVYDATECGAWGRVEEDGRIVFGTVIEGLDGDGITADPIETWEREEDDIAADISKTLAWLEAEANVLWHEANEAEDNQD